MKWELDDTTSDGIQFLLVGTGGLLVLRLLYAGVLLLMGVPDGDELDAAIAQFRHGYWISDTDVLVTTASSIGTRLALGLSASFVVALLAAGTAYTLARLVRKASSGPWLLVLRIALIVAFGWSLFAALLLPPSTATLNERGLTITQRPALFGVLSLPWSATVTIRPWSTVQSITVEETEQGATLSAVLVGSQVPLITEENGGASLKEMARLIEARYLLR